MWNCHLVRATFFRTLDGGADSWREDFDRTVRHLELPELPTISFDQQAGVWFAVLDREGVGYKIAFEKDRADIVIEYSRTLQRLPAVPVSEAIDVIRRLAQLYLESHAEQRITRLAVGCTANQPADNLRDATNQMQAFFGGLLSNQLTYARELAIKFNVRSALPDDTELRVNRLLQARVFQWVVERRNLAAPGDLEVVHHNRWQIALDINTVPGRDPIEIPAGRRSDVMEELVDYAELMFAGVAFDHEAWFRGAL
jgi:hypothetical protein